MEKIKVLIVDDSALIRQILGRIFNSSNDIEVVGSARDPIIARSKIKQLNPDVLTLDIQMPRMDGLTFLRNLMRLRPMPVVMISSLTETGAEATLNALQLGAVDFVAKPKLDLSNSLNDYAEEIIYKVKMAARARVHVLENRSKSGVPTQTDNANAVNVARHVDDQIMIIANKHTKGKIIALGASTGGTEAIKEVVKHLPIETPALVVSQHLPVAFSDSFAKHVNDVTEMHAFVAKDGQAILPGNIYIAPGDKHLLVEKAGAGYQCRLSDAAPVNRHKPSVDVMFRSVAQNVGNNAIGVMLTGMGTDGAEAMYEMCQQGAINIIQDEATSVVWGMPGEAYKLGAAQHVLPLEKIARQILALISK